jgi:HAD superfamily hydrolase (TIGR01509 family)
VSGPQPTPPAAEAAPPPALVIFDCDGVLVDTEPLAAQVMADIATELGRPMTAAECIDRFTGISLSQVKASLARDLGRPLPDDFEAQVRARDEAAFARALAPIDGAAAALDALAAHGVAMCVASSGAVDKMRFTLGQTGLLSRLEPHLFSATMVSRGKPAPDLFLHAAARMGVPPAACVVVEDAPAGIEAARAAAMAVLGFTGGGHCTAETGPRLKRVGAQAVFAQMRTLPALLGYPGPAPA